MLSPVRQLVMPLVLALVLTTLAHAVTPTAAAADAAAGALASSGAQAPTKVLEDAAEYFIEEPGDDEDDDVEEIGKKDGDDDIQAYFACIKDVDKEEEQKEEEQQEEDDYKYSELFKFLREENIVDVDGTMDLVEGAMVLKPIEVKYNVAGKEEQLRKAVKHYVWGRDFINDLTVYRKRQKIADVSAAEEKMRGKRYTALSSE